MAADFIELQIMKTKTIISRWHGWSAMIREICPSHYSLNILIGGDMVNENLVIAVINPEYIHGPTRWDENYIIVVARKLTSGNNGIAIVDEKNDVLIIGESFEVFENVKL